MRLINKISNKIWVIAIVFAIGCGGQETDSKDSPSSDEHDLISDEELLDLIQQETFRYFWEFAQKESGCARERYVPDDPSKDENIVTVGGTGFGIMAIIVAIDRGFITREEGIIRLGRILSFLESADRFHGAWPHWLDGTNGKVVPFSPKDNGGDLVETAFLVQGLICLYEFLKDGLPIEQEIADKAKALWNGVEWIWYTQNLNTLYWHWSPDHEFEMDFELKGYNEVLITYILAASSQDHGISKEVYINGWASNGDIRSGSLKYGLPLLVSHNGAQEYG
ncbi:MAG: beta-glucosidase, partial [Eudoraea sp.]|nr:beta-glucosidase [Eudoraea sp.]